jgi:hypothetical protein
LFCAWSWNIIDTQNFRNSKELSNWMTAS